MARTGAPGPPRTGPRRCRTSSHRSSSPPFMPRSGPHRSPSSGCRWPLASSTSGPAACCAPITLHAVFNGVAHGRCSSRSVPELTVVRRVVWTMQRCQTSSRSARPTGERVVVGFRIAFSCRQFVIFFNPISHRNVPDRRMRVGRPVAAVGVLADFRRARVNSAGAFVPMREGHAAAGRRVWGGGERGRSGGCSRRS